jgi:hypothetical protein
MLYYRLYKRMNAYFKWWPWGIGIPPSYLLFVVVIPLIASLIPVSLIQTYWIPTRTPLALIPLCFIIAAAVYVAFCEHYSKDRD